MCVCGGGGGGGGVVTPSFGRNCEAESGGGS